MVRPLRINTPRGEVRITFTPGAHPEFAAEVPGFASLVRLRLREGRYLALCGLRIVILVTPERRAWLDECSIAQQREELRRHGRSKVRS